jgi:hypothetical protein
MDEQRKRQDAAPGPQEAKAEADENEEQEDDQVVAPSACGRRHRSSEWNLAAASPDGKLPHPDLRASGYAANENPGDLRGSPGFST